MRRRVRAVRLPSAFDRRCVHTVCRRSIEVELAAFSAIGHPLSRDGRASQHRRPAPTGELCGDKDPNICCEHRREVAPAEQLQEDPRLYCCHYGALEIVRSYKTVMQKLGHSAQQNTAEGYS